jgi:hypothetical protein
MADTVPMAEPRRRRPGLPGFKWLRFPSNWVVAWRGTESFFSKAVWLVIPIQYYVLDQLSGGLRGAYVASAVVALVSIAALFAVSCLAALVYYRKRPGGDGPAKERPGFGTWYALGVRTWAIALIVTWATAHLVLWVSYLLGTSRGDFLYSALCGVGRCTEIYPAWDRITFVVYLIYTSIAVLLLVAISYGWLTGALPKPSPIPEPSIFVVIPLIAVLMVLINGGTTRQPAKSNDRCPPTSTDCPPPKAPAG